MRSSMTIARTAHGEQTIAPVATFHALGEVCPSAVATRPVTLFVTGAAGMAATDARTFVGTPAWSPPDR